GIKPTLTKKFSLSWNLVGLPLYPSNPLKDSVFSPFSSNYVLFKYSNGNYINSDSVLIGKAYWLGLNDTMNFSITGMPVLNDTTISLDNGWNLISLLYIKDLKKANLFIKNGTEVVSLDSAVNHGWVQSNLFSFSKSTNSYVSIDTLDQFTGYWFATLTSGLELKFVKNYTIGSLPKIKADFIDERNWIVQLSAQNSISRDNLFYFGLNEFASAGFDNKFDNAKPPIYPNDSAVELYFKRTNWHPLFTKYLSDIRKYSANQIYNWDFEFSSKRAEQSSINWKNLSEIFPPDYLELYYFLLIDLTNNRTIDMKSTNTYQFNHNGSVTRFTIRFGKLTSVNDEQNITEFRLGQNYPNPFNPKTKIQFEVKNKSFVSIKLYNTLGKEITTLVNEEKNVGKYEIEIDAEKLGIVSGVYFYKMIAGEFTSIKKLVYLK
ncbi:MAG: T9SS type A sorting domain-containing protein, partial [Ignavibacteria bacterium]